MKTRVKKTVDKKNNAKKGAVTELKNGFTIGELLTKEEIGIINAVANRASYVQGKENKKMINKQLNKARANKSK